VSRVAVYGAPIVRWGKGDRSMTTKIQAFIPALFQSSTRVANRPLPELDSDKPLDLVTLAATVLAVLVVGLIAALMGMT
jgi:hypothetical protein